MNDNTKATHRCACGSRQAVTDYPNLHIRGINPELYRQIRAAAILADVPVGELVNQAIREWLDKQRKGPGN